MFTGIKLSPDKIEFENCSYSDLRHLMDHFLQLQNQYQTFYSLMTYDKLPKLEEKIVYLIDQNGELREKVQELEKELFNYKFVMGLHGTTGK